MTKEKNYLAAQLEDLPTIQCPCGLTRRAFTEDPDQTASFHLLDVKVDAELHYHKKITEIYFILEGEGHLELDGEMFPVKPMSAVMIKPGTRHRAVGKMRIAIVAMPTFDPEDEWFD